MKTTIKKRKKIKCFDIVNNTILIMVALLCVYPFLYIFFLASSDGVFLARGEVTLLPKGFNLEAFKYVLSRKDLNVFSGLKNSFVYTAAGTVVGVFATYVTAYALSRPQIKHRYGLMALFTATWVFEAGIIPQYIIYSACGFVNNPLVMVIPAAINTQYLIICKNYLDGIPRELEEAAVVDGANQAQIMKNVYLPISKPIIATIGTFYAVSIWNQYMVPQMYLKEQGLQTIQQVLKRVVITSGDQSTAFRNVMQNGVMLNQENLKNAAIFVAMLPIVCVYPFVQKYFKKGILIGSVKG